MSEDDDENVELPGIKHKVIGLLSGGKDSCFNLLHCVANGHDIVALATLTPEPGVDELDSHLYQSVGTRLLPLIAESMGLPLYTQVIKGTAVERGPEYGSRDSTTEGVVGDETEDLTVLLHDVMAAHPEATALASGAILSNYQRLRIEHVCQRLELVSLAYLWQQPQLPLLDSMFRCGLDAVIVKVAGEGLGVNLVGKRLEDVRPLLVKLERLYGSHPAGEGGEYETITVSSPLFAKRLEFVKTSVVITDPEPYPVAHLRVEEAVLRDRPGWRGATQRELRDMLEIGSRYEAMDQDSLDLLEDLGDCTIAARDQSDLSSGSEPSVFRSQGVPFRKSGRWFAASVDGSTKLSEAVGDELRRCLEELSATLSSHDLSLALHAAHITLLLSSMDLFAPVNTVYSSFFGTSPPSRATVAVPLPPGQRVKVQIVGFDSTPLTSSGKAIGSRQALHVQSLSYWAPANIGPYSQAVHVNSRIHIAGQIPLIPASLTIPPIPGPSASSYLQQAVLALQHVRRIVEVLRSKHNTGGGWTGWIENCTAWWVQPGGNGAEGLDVVRRVWNAWTLNFASERVPGLFVRAKELPKGALVEFQVNLNTGRRDSSQPKGPTVPENGDSDIENDEEDPQARHTSSEESQWNTESCESTYGAQLSSRMFATCASVTRSLPTHLKAPLCRAIAVRCYTSPSLSTDDYNTISSWWDSFGSEIPCITYIPVLDISDSQGQSVNVALDIFGT